MAEYLTVREYARKWGFHPFSIYRYLKAGNIPDAVRIGRAWRIPVDALIKTSHNG